MLGPLFESFGAEFLDSSEVLTVDSFPGLDWLLWPVEGVVPVAEEKLDGGTMFQLKGLLSPRLGRPFDELRWTTVGSKGTRKRLDDIFLRALLKLAADLPLESRGLGLHGGVGRGVISAPEPGAESAMMVVPDAGRVSACARI